jgi:type VI protein secretion system component VasK
VDPNGVKSKLQPVDVVMPLANAKTFVGGNNQQYMEALGGLYNAVQAAVTTGATGGTAPLEQAATAVGPARDAVRKLAVKFSQEPEALLRLQDLLLSPVVGTEQLVKVALGGKKREGEAADVNAQALAFCEDIRPILDKYPFVLSARVKATNSDLARVFRPNGGRISQFYEQFLRGKVLTSNGGQFRSAGTGLVPTEQLTQFLTRAKRITDALFPGGSSEPRVQFTLRPQLSDPSPITVTFGDESFNAVKGSEQPFTASWRFGDSSYVGFARRGSNAAQDIGPWAPFKIYWEEARRAGPNGGRMYDIVLSGAIRGSVELTIAAGGLAEPAFFSGLNCPTKAVQ